MSISLKKATPLKHL